VTGVSKQEQYQRLLGHVVGYHASWFVDIGLKAGLFRAVAARDPGVGEDELANRLNVEARYVRVWCRGAYAFALLDWDEVTGYRLAPHMESLLLDPTDPHFCGGRIQFTTALYEDYLAFPEHLRTGDIWPRSAHDPFLLEALRSLTAPDAVMITEQVLPQASSTLERLEAGGDILDIGAGAGLHVLHYARRFSRARVVGLEPDQPSIELARDALAQADVADRVELRCEDAHELAAGEAFDLVTLNLTLHETGDWSDFQDVLVRVHRALKPGGTVVVSELPYPDSPAEYRQNPVYKLFAGVQLHEALVGCGMITQGQLRELLEGAGFDAVRVAEQSMPTRFVMLAGKETSS
jgi:SAM-dependent methyltransferase